MGGALDQGCVRWSRLGRWSGRFVSCPGFSDHCCRGARQLAHPDRGAPACRGFLAHLPARQQANSVLDQRLCAVGVYPRVDRLETNVWPWGSGEVSMVGSVPHTSACRRPLTWRGVCPWGKSAITRRCRTLSRSNRRFLVRGLAARASLPASSAGYSLSGLAWRTILWYITEGLGPVK